MNQLFLIGFYVLMSSCGSSQNESVGPQGKRGSLDNKVHVFDPTFFVIDESVEDMNQDELKEQLFNERGFLFANIFVNPDDRRLDCQRTTKEPVLHDDGSYRYELELSGLDCVNHLQPETQKVIAMDVFVMCKDGQIIENPESVVSGSAFDSRFQPCGARNDYDLRASRKTHILFQGEESDSGHVEVSNLMASDGGYCSVRFGEDDVTLNNCNEYTKISESIKLNGESTQVKVLAVRHLLSKELSAKAEEVFYKSGSIRVRLNNWSGQITYQLDKPKFEISNGVDKIEGELAESLFQSTEASNVFLNFVK